jgi:succinoglycan biosynthesis transport protein ExoP
MNAYLEMEENTKSLADYIAIVRRRWKKMIAPALAVFVLMFLIAMLWPATYRSTATILIEQQQVPQEFVRSAITSYANEQIEVITQRIMTLNNVFEIINKYEVFTESELRRGSRTDIYQEFVGAVKRAQIKSEIIDQASRQKLEATIAFTLSFEHKNPKIAQAVANELVNLYLNENLKQRQEKSSSTSQFLKAEASAVKKQIAEIEEKISDFKIRNEGAMPELYQYNLSVIERTDNEISVISQRLSEIEQRELKLESDLAQQTPYAPTVAADGKLILGDYDRLKSLKAEYAKKRVAYNADHPDIVRLQREIKTLEATLGTTMNDLSDQLRTERDMLQGLKQKYSTNHPEVVKQSEVVKALEKEVAASKGIPDAVKDRPDNPAYVMLKTQLDAARAEKSALLQRQEALRKKIADIEALVMKTPTIEKEYKQLSLDLINATAKYQEITAKEMSSQISLNMETERKGERFTLIEPPILPEDPVSPNRPVLVLLGFILALVAGVGSIAVREMLDSSLRGAKAVAAVMNTEPLVTIPYFVIDAELKEGLERRYKILIGLVVAGIVVLLLVHFAYKPLDVIWYVVQRKLGLG